MLELELKLFCFSAFLITAAHSVTDYCGRGLCSLTGYRHVTCDATGNLLATCPQDARVVPLYELHIQHILDSHNRLRNQIASGAEPGFNPAAKMTTLTWNQNLADYAGLNVRRCQFGHDCHNSPEFMYSGQNINIEVGFDINLNFEETPVFIEHTINVWWNEKQHATQANIDNCCGAGEISHFLEMASDRVNQVGCAVSQYTDAQGRKSYMVCNYSLTLINDQKVYESGAPTSKCKSGPNSMYPALCRVNEPIDPNKVF